MTKHAVRPFTCAIPAFAATILIFLCAGAQAGYPMCNQGWCIDVQPGYLYHYPMWIRITQNPYTRTTHRNIRWNGGGNCCQVESDSAALSEVNRPWPYQVLVQNCNRDFFGHSRCSPWTRFDVW